MRLSRRSFLKSVCAASVAPALPGCRCLSGAPGPGVALQLYSIRGLMKDPPNFKAALKAVKGLGYAGVEFAGYCGFTPAEIRVMLGDFGLAAAGTHTGLNTVTPAEIGKTLDFCAAAGIDNVVVPWANAPKGCKDRAGYWKKLADDLSAAAETAARAGCHLGFHNHKHEIAEKIDGVAPQDILFRNASDKLFMQPDVGHIAAAGESPADWIRRYPGRVRTLHAAETLGTGGKGVLGQPGAGAHGVDWPSVFAATDATQNTRWYIVECEADPDTLEHAKGCRDFLHAAGRC